MEGVIIQRLEQQLAVETQNNKDLKKEVEKWRNISKDLYNALKDVKQSTETFIVEDSLERWEKVWYNSNFE